jgi:formate--tetrahydrofolate ligase
MSLAGESMAQPADIAIPRAEKLRPIETIAAALALPGEMLFAFGRHIAKVRLQALAQRPATGRLVLVTGINPTPAGEGKTTTTVGLVDALSRRGLRAAACLREPSLGPCFGERGGAGGGGRAQACRCRRSISTSPATSRR